MLMHSAVMCDKRRIKWQKAISLLSEKNKKVILNFIGMCRMNGLEMAEEPSFTFKKTEKTSEE